MGNTLDGKGLRKGRFTVLVIVIIKESYRIFFLNWVLVGKQTKLFVLRYSRVNLKWKVLLLQHKYSIIDRTDNISSVLLSFSSFTDWSVLILPRNWRYSFYLSVAEDNNLTYEESFRTFSLFFLLSWPLRNEIFMQIWQKVMTVSNIRNNEQKYANMGTSRTLS